MATLWRRACSTVSRIVCSSPAWPPQAIFADVRKGMSASCVPSSIMERSSPTSELISIAYFASQPPELREHLLRRGLIQRLHRIGDDGHRLAIFQQSEGGIAHANLGDYAVHHVALRVPLA